MATHTLSFGSSGLGATISGLNVEKTFNGGPTIEGFTIPIATDTQYDIAVVLGDMESVFLYATCDCTIETNSGTVPDDTFTMVANEPLIWWSGSPIANPFTASITALFITAAAAGVLYGRFGTVQP